MEQNLKDIESHLTNSDLARVDLENRFEARLKKLENALKELEKADDAQITLNQHFNQKIISLEILLEQFAVRLQKEETKPLVTIPAVPIWPEPKPSFFNRLFNKK